MSLNVEAVTPESVFMESLKPFFSSFQRYQVNEQVPLPPGRVEINRRKYNNITLCNFYKTLCN
jgi:hypothetical protein